MASTIWKGYITFGLLSIPVRIHAAARSERISFNQLHAPCKGRIKQQVFCPSCNKVVERNELLKGYEFEKNNYLVIEDDELKKIAPASSETMEIVEFVKLDEVDPLYFDTSYVTMPEEAGRRAYHLLVSAMETAGYAAIAKLAMHQREYTVIIRPRAHGLTLHTIYYEHEVRDIPGYGEETEFQVRPQEVEMAKRLVESMAAAFEPKKYADAYQTRLQELLEAKRQGVEVKETEARPLAPVIDLMEALQRSLAMNAEKKPAHGEEESRPAATGPKRVKTASG